MDAIGMIAGGGGGGAAAGGMQSLIGGQAGGDGNGADYSSGKPPRPSSVPAQQATMSAMGAPPEGMALMGNAPQNATPTLDLTQLLQLGMAKQKPNGSFASLIGM